MRCNKKANYIFQDLMIVLIFWFFCIKTKERYKISFQIIIYLIVFLFPFEASKGNKNASIFKVPACPLPYLKKISPCRCICFASWLNPLHMAKPIRLHKPKLEIFLHSTAKIMLRERKARLL